MKRVNINKFRPGNTNINVGHSPENRYSFDYSNFDYNSTHSGNHIDFNYKYPNYQYSKIDDREIRIQQLEKELREAEARIRELEKEIEERIIEI